MNTDALLAVKALGQHVWLDNLSRPLLREGTLLGLIQEHGIDGVTSNPAIIHRAITGSLYYKEDIERLRDSHLDAEACYDALVIPDIQAACDVLWPTYLSSGGEAGYASLEVSPVFAHDAVGTEGAARRLRRVVGRDNLLVKVPATPAGVRAFEQLIAVGVRVNAALIYSLAQYEAVAQAYLRGARRWLEDGGAAEQLRAVASVFVSRIDVLVDGRLDAVGGEQALALKGQAGVALAKCCYQRYLEIFHGPSFAMLEVAGVRPLTLLWASTGSKNPAYSDVHYVEALIGPETIDTLPSATLEAFLDHGRAAATLTGGVDAARAHVERLAALGIDLGTAGKSLQIEGLRLFAEAYKKILIAVSIAYV